MLEIKVEWQSAVESIMKQVNAIAEQKVRERLEPFASEINAENGVVEMSYNSEGNIAFKIRNISPELWERIEPHSAAL